MTKIRATPTSFHGNNKGHTISETLKKTNYVFIRNDAHRTPLQRVYDGPYKVLKRTPKYFTLSKNGNTIIIQMYHEVLILWMFIILNNNWCNLK